MKNGRYFSTKFNSAVWLQIDKYDWNYDVCECCGKPLKTVYSVTPESDGLEYLYGSECVKTLGLKPMKEETT